MFRRKSIRWALALLIIFAVVTTVIYRIERNKQKALVELAKKKKGKARSMPVQEPPDEPEPPPEKAPKVTVLGPAAKEHLAEKSFISALRAVFLWRSSQPKSPETHQILLEKLSAIAFEDLPPERKSAWQSLLQSWKVLDDPIKAADPQIEAQARRAAEALNVMLKAHGDGDLAF